MFKSKDPLKIVLVIALIFICSCRNEQDEKQATQIPKDAGKNPGGGTGKSDSSGSGSSGKKDSVLTNKNNFANTVDSKSKKTVNKTKENSSGIQDTAATKIKPAATVKNDNNENKNTAPPGPPPASNISVNTPFVSKYGVIPRNTTLNDMIEFFKAFPDKSTIIKVNFDGPSDDEMNAVKTQIIKLLRNSGYANVQDQSVSIEPQRMPKEIHYELQRNGSVIFWVPIASTDQ